MSRFGRRSKYSSFYNPYEDETTVSTADPMGSALDNNGNAQTPKPLSKAEFEAAGYNLTDRQIDAQAAGVTLPEGIKPNTALEWNTDQALTASPTIAKGIPKAKFLDFSSKAATAKSFSNIGAVAGALDKLFNKPKDPGVNIGDPGQGALSQVAVAPGINPDEYLKSLRQVV